MPQSGNPTMADVARAANVSTATVSRILRGVEGASSGETSARVRRCAEELGYIVNGVASSMRSQQTLTVGLVIADVSNPWWGQLAGGVESVLGPQGFSVILANTDNNVERERRAVETLLRKQVDALIVASSADDGSHLRGAISRQIRVVLVDTELPGLDVDSITIDNEAAARTAVEHLLDHGHQEVAIVGGGTRASCDVARLRGLPGRPHGSRDPGPPRAHHRGLLEVRGRTRRCRGPPGAASPTERPVRHQQRHDGGCPGGHRRGRPRGPQGHLHRGHRRHGVVPHRQASHHGGLRARGADGPHGRRATAAAPASTASAAHRAHPCRDRVQGQAERRATGWSGWLASSMSHDGTALESSVGRGEAGQEVSVTREDMHIARRDRHAGPQFEGSRLVKHLLTAGLAVVSIAAVGWDGHRPIGLAWRGGAGRAGGGRERPDRRLARRDAPAGHRGLAGRPSGAGRPGERRGRGHLPDPGQDRARQQRRQGLAGRRLQRRQPHRHDGHGAERLGHGPGALRAAGAARPVRGARHRRVHPSGRPAHLPVQRHRAERHLLQQAAHGRVRLHGAHHLGGAGSPGREGGRGAPGLPHRGLR